MYVSIPFVHISLSNPARDVLFLSSKVTPLFPLYHQDTTSSLSRSSKIINFSVQPLSIFQPCKILPPQPVFSWQKQFTVTSGSQRHMQSQDSILFICFLRTHTMFNTWEGPHIDYSFYGKGHKSSTQAGQEEAGLMMRKSSDSELDAHLLQLRSSKTNTQYVIYNRSRGLGRVWC